MSPLAFDVDEVLKAYGDAWLETDKGKRQALLDVAWADDGLYQDPSGEAFGRDALVAHIGNFHTQQPGARAEMTSGASLHHNKIFFTWRMVTADGAVLVEGYDFGTVGEDGRLVQVIGFFGPPPILGQ